MPPSPMPTSPPPGPRSRPMPPRRSPAPAWCSRCRCRRPPRAPRSRAARCWSASPMRARPGAGPGLAEAGIDVAAMELLPRITRAQSMDVLSQPGQPGRLPRRDRGRRRVRPRVRHDDDRRRHRAAGPRVRGRRGRRRAAGDRHRPPAGRHRVGDRRAAGGQGGDQVARRHLRRRRGRGDRGADRRLCPHHERRLPRQAGRADDDHRAPRTTW